MGGGACESALSFQVAESNCSAVCRRGCETVLTATMSVVPHTQRRGDQRRRAGGGELEAPRPRTHPEAGLPDRVLPVRRKPGARRLPAQTRPAQQTGICQRQAAHFIQKGNRCSDAQLVFFCFFSGKTQQLCTCLSNTTQHNITHCHPDVVALQAQAVRHTSSLCSRSCSPLISARRLILPCAARR